MMIARGLPFLPDTFWLLFYMGWRVDLYSAYNYDGAALLTLD